MRWKAEHGRKRRYRTKLGAWWHARAINRKPPEWRKHSKFKDGGAWVPYPCWWGEEYRDGENAKKHWHVGRTPKVDPRIGYPNGKYEGYKVSGK